MPTEKELGVLVPSLDIPRLQFGANVPIKVVRDDSTEKSGLRIMIDVAMDGDRGACEVARWLSRGG